MGSGEDMSEQFLFTFFRVRIGGGVSVRMTMEVDREDVMGTCSFSSINVLQSILLCYGVGQVKVIEVICMKN